MKGKLPTVFAGIVVRNDNTNALVAFHAIADLISEKEVETQRKRKRSNSFGTSTD